MTLANGSTLLGAGIYVLQWVIGGSFWDGISAYELIIAMILLTIIGNFIARMIKGKAHSEIAVQSEDKSTYNLNEHTGERGDIDAYWAERGIDRSGQDL